MMVTATIVNDGEYHHNGIADIALHHRQPWNAHGAPAHYQEVQL
jgi:hypothetical protein